MLPRLMCAVVTATDVMGVVLVAVVGATSGAQLPSFDALQNLSTDASASVVSVATAALGCIVLATMMAAVCTFCSKKPLDDRIIAEDDPSGA